MNRLGIYYKIIKWLLNSPPVLKVGAEWYVKRHRGDVIIYKILEVTKETVVINITGSTKDPERFKIEDVEFLEKVK